jgi:polyketide biosynthesis enoyl-CoA hydratase PksI
MASTVELTRPHPGVARLAMEDREGSNTFTLALVQGLFERMAEIAADPELRVVVLHGYDSVFLAGGTLGELLDIADGTRSFDDKGFYRLLLDCPLPVIAAMQGHAMGGGFVFGLYADIVMLARESIYGTNFMKYGFTPGMGATEIVPRKLGEALAAEMLYSARAFHGGRLAERGIPFAVLPRAELIAQALALAAELADKPRLALTLLKQRLTADLRARLPEAIATERQMHEATFARPETRARITQRFGN